MADIVMAVAPFLFRDPLPRVAGVVLVVVAGVGAVGWVGTFPLEPSRTLENSIEAF